MSDFRALAKQSAGSWGRDGNFVGARALRDGTLFGAPWELALIMEGKVFGSNAGDVSTGIAGHATITAAQPELAVRATSDSLVIIPIAFECLAQSFEITLGIHEVMFAASNIDVGAGTSTAETAFNLNMSSAAATSATIRSAYTANGTDPLTAGNFYELGRNAGNFDSDAATSGITGLRLAWSMRNGNVPIIARTGSLLGYGGGGTTANFFFNAVWAELTQAEVE